MREQTRRLPSMFLLSGLAGRLRTMLEAHQPMSMNSFKPIYERNLKQQFPLQRVRSLHKIAVQGFVSLFPLLHSLTQRIHRGSHVLSLFLFTHFDTGLIEIQFRSMTSSSTVFASVVVNLFIVSYNWTASNEIFAAR